MIDTEIIRILTDYGTQCRPEIINEAIASLTAKRQRLKKIKKKLQYYLNTNEENGVVYIPKFVVDNLVKEMTEVEN